jgi:Xaa-Pro aminopeptidase
MSISQQEFQRRYKAIRALMEKDELDSLLIIGLGDDFNRGNIRYITGSGRGGCCIFPMEGSPIFFMGVQQLASPKLSATLAALELLDLQETAHPAEEAVHALSRLDKGNRIGIIGMGCISVPMYLAVKEAFGERVLDRTAMLELLRVVKSAEEIEKTRQAAAIADTVFHRLREIVRPGLSEYEIYGEVKKITYEMGCEYSFDLIDGAGATMNMSFYPTTDRLETNGTLFMEITPAYEGYYAQLPVTLPVVNYPSHVRQMVRAWSEADTAAFRLLRPGTKVSDVYHMLVDTVHARGFISPYRPGHAIGLDALDFWSITEDNQRILAAGMVLAVHPSVLQKFGGDGCGMGYTYLITDTGAEKLSKIDLARELLGNSS